MKDERSRGKRPHEIPGKSLPQRISQRQLERDRRAYPDDGTRLPATRAGCASVPRPCPFVSCRYHLYLDVNERTGRIKLNRPELEPGELADSCALDIADRGPSNDARLMSVINVTRERVRQIQREALRRLDELTNHDLMQELRAGLIRAIGYFEPPWWNLTDEERRKRGNAANRRLKNRKRKLRVIA